MDKAQTDLESEAPAAPDEERAARHLRLLARAAEIQMEVMEATRTEAVEAPQPGVDYCQRLAVITRSLRLTLLLEEKMAETRRQGRRRTVGRRVAVAEADRPLRVFMAVAAAIDETIESEAEGARLGHEVREHLERPEVAERVESTPAPEMVAELCRRYGLSSGETEEWLAIADVALEELGYLAPGDDPPEDSPKPSAAGKRKARSPDTG